MNKVTVTAHLRDTRDGTLYTYANQYDWSRDGETAEGLDIAYYCWTDGNYGCDCNRSVFIARASGDNPSFDDHLPCSENVIVLEKLIDDATGKDMLADDYKFNC